MLRAGVIAVLAAMLTPATLNVIASPVTTARPDAAAVGFARGAAEHRYRIAGKLRLALFWVGRDDVGSARMSWRSDGTSSELTLLVGSDPQRAPRGLNQWGYLREEVRRGSADVFSLRTVDPESEAPATGFAIGDGPDFGASCASVGNDEVSSRQTRVNGRGLTYRMFGQLLDRIAAASQWELRQLPRPLGSAAGFLTAMQHAIRAAEAAAHDGTFKTVPPVAYVYNGAVYDLKPQGHEHLGPTTVGTRTFDQLARTDFSIRNRSTADVTRFGVMYSVAGGAAPLPVQISYQPSFWLRVELRLDDDADVPADPAADEAVLTRIRAICDRATR